MKRGILKILALLFLSCSNATFAAITVTVEEQASGVVISYSGSWDSLDGNTSNTFNLIRVNEAQLFNISAGDSRLVPSENFTKDSGLWTTISNASASSASGDSFGFAAGVAGIATFYAPANYSSGESIAGSLTFSGHTLTSLGFTAGDSGTFSGAGNIVNFTVVPEPSAFAAVTALVVAGCLVFVRRRRPKV